MLSKTKHSTATAGVPVKTSWMWYAMMALYLVYLGQATFFGGNALIGQLLIFVILFIGLVSLIRSLFRSRILPSSLKWIIAMLVVLTISFIVSPKIVYSRILPPTATLNQFKDMVAFFIPIFTGYQIGLHKKLSSRQWMVVALFILAISIQSFIEAQAQAFLKFHKEESTNNSAYIFLYLFPLLPLTLKKYKLLTFGLLGVMFAFVMMGAKRGAILCMAVLFIYATVWYLRERRITFGTIVVLTALIVGLILGVEYYFATSDYLQQRLEQTLDSNSSGRDTLYSILWETWLNADLLTQLIGHGSAQTITIAENYAHNDWLEFLTNQGLVGAFLYLAIFVSLFRFRKNFPLQSPERCTFTMIVLLWFLKSIFSMGTGIMAGIDLMMLGTFIGNAVADKYLRAKPSTPNR